MPSKSLNVFVQNDFFIIIIVNMIYSSKSISDIKVDDFRIIL
jgi:hypothetical protein